MVSCLLNRARVLLVVGDALLGDCRGIYVCLTRRMGVDTGACGLGFSWHADGLVSFPAFMFIMTMVKCTCLYNMYVCMHACVLIIM